MMNVEQSVEWVTGKTEVLRRNLTQCCFVHHKSHIIWPGLEPGPPRWDANEYPPELWSGYGYCLTYSQNVFLGMTLGFTKLHMATSLETETFTVSENLSNKSVFTFQSERHQLKCEICNPGSGNGKSAVSGCYLACSLVEKVPKVWHKPAAPVISA
jgi:hypothetical protein